MGEAVNWIGQEITPGDVVAYAAARGSATQHQVGVVELTRDTGTARVHWVSKFRTGKYRLESSRVEVGNVRVDRLYRLPFWSLSRELQASTEATRAHLFAEVSE
ncbi:hypothetical protein [Nocardia gipuzkoensis]